MLAEDIARLMSQIPHEEAVVAADTPIVKGIPEEVFFYSRLAATWKYSLFSFFYKGGAFEGMQEKIDNPFGFGKGEGVDAGYGEPEWIVNKDRFGYDETFNTLNPIDGKITGASAKAEMVKSKLPNSVLGKIWKLSDVDKDGMLDSDEFALAMHLIKVKLDGHDLPVELPAHLIPPSKRNDYWWFFFVGPITPSYNIWLPREGSLLSSYRCFLIDEVK